MRKIDLIMMKALAIYRIKRYFCQGNCKTIDFDVGFLAIREWKRPAVMMKKPKKRTWMKRPPMITF
jgi:hypothetical protein